LLFALLLVGIPFQALSSQFIPFQALSGPLRQRNHNDVKLTNQQKKALNPRTRTQVPMFVKKYPNGIVPYVIDPTATMYKDVILKASADFKNKTCIKLIPHTTEDYFVKFVVPPEDFAGCGASPLGMQDKQQEINLGAYVTDGQPSCGVSTVIHEVMHSLGFLHEMDRYDRDNYIQYKDGKGPDKFPQYATDPKCKTMTEEQKEEAVRMDDTTCGINPDSDGSPYDYKSIMHYSWDISEQTIVSPRWKDKSEYIKATQIGLSESLTPCDVAKVNRFYKCGGNYKTTFVDGDCAN